MRTIKKLKKDWVKQNYDDEGLATVGAFGIIVCFLIVIIALLPQMW